METNTFQVLQYLWGAGKLKIPCARRSSPRDTMKKFKSRQKRNTQDSSLMPRPWKCWNLCCCLQCCGFDPPGNTCLQPHFPFARAVHHIVPAPASAISFLGLSSRCSSSSPVCFSKESCLDEAIPGARQSNCSSFLKKETWGKKEKKNQQNVKEKRSGEGPEQLCGTAKEASRNYHLLHGENESYKEGILPAVNDYRRLRRYL